MIRKSAIFLVYGNLDSARLHRWYEFISAIRHTNGAANKKSYHAAVTAEQRIPLDNSIFVGHLSHLSRPSPPPFFLFFFLRFAASWSAACVASWRLFYWPLFAYANLLRMASAAASCLSSSVIVLGSAGSLAAAACCLAFRFYFFF